MGTILPRKRKDGTTGFTALITLKQNGKIAHREAKTFDRRRRRTPGWNAGKPNCDNRAALTVARTPSWGAVIDKYITESKREIGRTKSQVLRTIKSYGHRRHAMQRGSLAPISLASRKRSRLAPSDGPGLSQPPCRDLRRSSPGMGISARPVRP